MKYIFIFVIAVVFSSCVTIKKIENKEKTINYYKKADFFNNENKLNEAIYFYKKDFTLNKNSNAAYELAKIYRYKIKDYRKMKYWYLKANDLKHDNALFELSIYYYLKDDNKALSYIQNPSIKSMIGVRASKTKLLAHSVFYEYYKKKQYQKALKLIKKNSYYINLYPINNLYENSRKKNYKDYNIYKEKPYNITSYIEKYKLIKEKELDKYEEMKTKDSYYELARWNRYVFLNYRKTIEYYELAHKARHKDAAFELAHLYKNRFYDIKNTIKWYEESNIIGNKQAAFELALFYDFNLNSYDNAIAWYKKAFKQSHKAAATNISLIYKDKLKNYTKHLLWTDIY